MSQQDNKVILAIARGAEAQGTLERISEASEIWQADSEAERARHEDHVLRINGRLASTVLAVLTEHQRRLDALDASGDDDEKELGPF